MSSKQKQAEYRQNLIGTDFILTPSEESLRVYIVGQIITANNFPNQEIFISYKFNLPTGWKPQFPEEYSNLSLTDEQFKQINCLESITHSVSPVIVQKEQGGVTNQFYFSFPFDLQLVVPEKDAENQWPKILFQVFSKDGWDRIYMHGCGFVNIPPKVGMHDLKSQTWKPALSMGSKVSQFFLGGLIRPKNLEDISYSWHVTEQDKLGPINRSQFSTESSGIVNFRVNVATQSKKVKIDERMTAKTYKKSYQTQLKRNELDSNQMSSLPSNFNTQYNTGMRYTNTILQ